MSGISFHKLDPHDRYKLLCGVVVPRPIALVTTLDENGKVNAAPFSFFNVFSEYPPLVVLGLQHKADLSPKDTTRNIHRSGLGEVVRLHAREDLIDKERMHVDFDVYRPIGRLFGNLYAGQRDTFALTRESHAQWLARVQGGNGAGDPSDQSQ